MVATENLEQKAFSFQISGSGVLILSFFFPGLLKWGRTADATPFHVVSRS